MVCTVIDKGAVKILGNINNDLMAIPGRAEGTTVDDGRTDPMGGADHKGVRTGDIIRCKKIPGSFMESKTGHVRIVTQRISKSVVRGSKLSTTDRKSLGKGNRLFGKTSDSGSENLCGSISLGGGTVPQLSVVIVSKRME